MSVSLSQTREEVRLVSSQAIEEGGFIIRKELSISIQDNEMRATIEGCVKQLDYDGKGMCLLVSISGRWNC